VNPPGKTFYVTIAGLVGAVILGGLTNGDTISVVALVMGLGLCFALYRVLWRNVLPEAVVLGGLLFGYIVGQWGFAHTQLAGENPIYFGEVGLVACFGIFGLRMAFTKERFIHRDALSWTICAFMVVGGLRYFADLFQIFGNWRDSMTVTRDFATIYYAAFYFISFKICEHEPSRRFLEWVFPRAILYLIPVFAATLIFPQLYEKLATTRFPLLPRGDLSGSFLGFGGIYFLLSREGKGHWIFRTLVGLSCFALMFSGLSRATFVGFAFSVSLLLIAGKVKAIRDIVIFGIIGVLGLLAFEEVRGKEADDNFGSRLKDKIVSLSDFGSGKQQEYATDVGTSSAGNNRFRTEWWTSVYNETMEYNPVFGLGFGYDLAARFLRTYDAHIDPEEFSARSPHSILFTIFGRMGAVGILSLGLVVFLVFRSALRCAWDVRMRRIPAMHLAPWCGIATIFVTACFGVMLEGPMAATVFWTLLGLGAYRQAHQQAETKAPDRKGSPRERPAPLRPPLVGAYN